jgi:diguanylate cyclase (GGDEF)-like protein
MQHSPSQQPAADHHKQWELSLDQAGSADTRAIRHIVIFTAAIIVTAMGVLAFGAVQLPAFPQFSIFHAGFVFLVDAITAFLLFGQFRYRRLPLYAVLASAYLFTALVSIPFILSFPGALKAEGSVIGGMQSSIWVWHLWHTIFPAIVAFSLALHQRYCGSLVVVSRIPRMILASVSGAAVLAVLVALAVTEFHDQLPVLIGPQRVPLPPFFYVFGGLATAVTAFATWLAWLHGLRQRAILHLWLAVSLTAFLADVVISMFANARYTFAWYFGRIESMIAASVLLLIFLGELNRLYRKLAESLTDLAQANEKLTVLVDEKGRLVAELQQSEEQVRQLAYFDFLTGLPNRRLLLDRLHQAVSQARRHGYSMAIMFLDLDHFKQINDTLGHDVGDELLKQVAARLVGCIRSGDTVSRSGGDEFILVMPEIALPFDAAVVAQKIIDALNEPILIGTHHLHIGVSIGIAIYPVDGSDDMLELMKKADTAMYAAKESGRNNYRFYGEEYRAVKTDEPG